MIHVRLEDERGKEIAVIFSPPRSQFASLIPEATVSDYPCLRYVDPYGNTTFNELQIPQLLADLERTLPRCTTPETRKHVEAIMALAKQATKGHTYIKFYGD